ncbi:unnamed protein product [marine sediment metagenome]|uniref:Uncharacterized protein n=1 Tax=marine sediment metagenome TaxID=412755 RepID=X1QZ48_9ZZZZ
MSKKFSTLVKERNKKINRRLAGKKAGISAKANKKIKELLENGFYN